jgi:hypothetical protein
LEASLAGLRVNLNIALVLFHDSLHRVQAQTGPLPHSLGSEEWIEHVGLYFGRNSRAIVGNLDDDTIVVAKCFYLKFPLATHGINRVVDNVCPDLI